MDYTIFLKDEVLYVLLAIIFVLFVLALRKNGFMLDYGPWGFLPAELRKAFSAIDSFASNLMYKAQRLNNNSKRTDEEKKLIRGIMSHLNAIVDKKNDIEDMLKENEDEKKGKELV